MTFKIPASTVHSHAEMMTLAIKFFRSLQPRFLSLNNCTLEVILTRACLRVRSYIIIALNFALLAAIRK